MALFGILIGSLDYDMAKIIDSSAARIPIKGHHQMIILWYPWIGT